MPYNNNACAASLRALRAPRTPLPAEAGKARLYAGQALRARWTVLLAEARQPRMRRTVMRNSKAEDTLCVSISIY